MRIKDKGSKLAQLMKGIKNSNQLSTKAVVSVKKNIKHYFEAEQAAPRMSAMFSELISLREEMHALKQENLMLRSMMEAKDFLRDSRTIEGSQAGTLCPHCGGDIEAESPRFRFTTD